MNFSVQKRILINVSSKSFFCTENIWGTEHIPEGLDITIVSCPVGVNFGGILGFLCMCFCGLGLSAK